MMSLVMRFMTGSGSSPSVDGSTTALNAWRENTPLTLRLYLHRSRRFAFDDAVPLRTVEGLQYNWKESNNVDFEEVISVDSYLASNGSMFLHAFLAHDDMSWPPSKFAVDSENACLRIVECIHRSRALVEYHPAKQVVLKSLLEDSSAQVANSNDERWISSWVPEVPLQTVMDLAAIPRAQIVAPIADFIELDPQSRNYKPTTFYNEFLILRERNVPLNSSVPAVTLKFSFSMTSNWKFMLMAQMFAMMDNQAKMGLSDSNAKEEMKRMFVETNPILLGTTMVVSLFHSVFEFLAFKNDVSFWKSNQSLDGVSVRMIFINAFSQLIVFLYLLDNETSWMILISAGVGVLIEFWKIKKAMHVTVARTASGIPTLHFEAKESYSARTEEFDVIATRYLSYVAAVLLLGYAIYSVLYNAHKSWYSFVLNTLVGFIYAFGFISMTPQLFINYKMKSVAHLPWRTFMYRFCNTIIDDLFSFIVKMPFLHRISVFKDDIVFLILLYQRWIYPVDANRNEMGQRVTGADVVGSSSVAESSSTDASVSVGKPKQE